VHRATVEGNGPVDATFNAIAALVPHTAKLKLFQVSAVTQGTDAQAEVTVRLETPDGRIVNGNSSDIDTLVAAAHAYINALCKLINTEKRLTLVSN
jgi:2-isopropylmalate synthase